MVSQGERARSSVSRVDPQLLKMALSPYPKLKAALFPVSGPRGTTATSSDISVYHLMQVLYHIHTVQIICLLNVLCVFAVL